MFYLQSLTDSRHHCLVQTWCRSLCLQFPLSALKFLRIAECSWPSQAPAYHTHCQWEPLSGGHRENVNTANRTSETLCGQTHVGWESSTCRASSHAFQLHVPRTALVEDHTSKEKKTTNQTYNDLTSDKMIINIWCSSNWRGGFGSDYKRGKHLR